MQIRLLGTVEVAGGDGAAALGGPMERRLLALLAIHAGSVVSEDRIVDALWRDAAPRTAPKTVASYVSRLRKVLGSGEGFAIESRPPGYRLSVPPRGTDVVAAGELAERARAAMAGGDSSAAAELYGEVLAAWRGPALGEFADEAFAEAEAHRLEELRLALVESRVDAEMACGRHASLVGELEALCGAHPTREHLWAQRITALYRSGRQAEALSAYRQLRHYLAEELGIDPSPELQDLERAVLSQDSSLAWAGSQAPGAGPAAPVGPVELPSGVVTFLLTDVVGSTRLWEAQPRAMAEAVRRHDELIRAAVEQAGGVLVKARGEGDSTFSVFRRATQAATAALAAQHALADEAWPSSFELTVRMAIHTGEAHERDGDYYGPTVNRAARLRTVASGGQILVSRSTAELLRDHLVDAELVELGPQVLADLARPEQTFALMPRAGPGGQVAPEAAPESVRLPLPPALAPPAEAFVGRTDELARLLAAVGESPYGRQGAVFLAGEPGIGKTRLMAAAAAAAHSAGALVLYGRCDE